VIVPAALALRWRWVTVASVALVALGALVATGHLTGVDQWSVDHLMPFQDRPVGEPSTLDQVMSPLAAVTRGSNDWVTRTLFAVTLPVAPLPAALAGAIGVLALMVTKRWRRAFAWSAALAAAALAEVAIKDAVERPLLHKFDAVRDGVVGKDSFNHSFPSGHTVRGILLVMLFVELVPRLRVALTVWVVAMSVVLVLASMHTPSDVVGGALLALLVLPLLELLTGRSVSDTARALRSGQRSERADSKPPDQLVRTSRSR
jgi:membrane-associated phospholipid phosphatase